MVSRLMRPLKSTRPSKKDTAPCNRALREQWINSPSTWRRRTPERKIVQYSGSAVRWLTVLHYRNFFTTCTVEEKYLATLSRFSDDDWEVDDLAAQLCRRPTRFRRLKRCRNVECNQFRHNSLLCRKPHSFSGSQRKTQVLLERTRKQKESFFPPRSG